MGCSCSYNTAEMEEIIKSEAVRFKVLITGLRKVGKTSVLQSAFWDSPEKISTKSCLCYSKKVSIKGTPSYIDIWDTNLVSSTYFVDMNVLLLVVDLSDAGSLNINVEKVREFSNNIIVAGNKFDISDSDVYKAAQALAKDIGGFFVPISTLNGFGLKDVWNLVLYLISNL